MLNYNTVYEDISNYITQNAKLGLKYNDSQLEIIEYNKRNYNKVSCSDILEFGADILKEIIDECTLDVIAEED